MNGCSTVKTSRNTNEKDLLAGAYVVSAGTFNGTYSSSKIVFFGVDRIRTK
jgi:hypothetical protein